jgi:hypothetical protein
LREDKGELDRINRINRITIYTFAVARGILDYVTSFAFFVFSCGKRSAVSRDRLTKERRSWNMSRIRGKNTTPEMRVRSLLHRMGYRF